MPSAIAAVSGEMNRFESGLACRAISPNSLKAKRLSAPMRPLSPASSARGRLVMGRGAVIGASRQRAPTTPRATASNGPTYALMLPPETGAFLTLPRRHPREVTIHVVPAAIVRCCVITTLGAGVPRGRGTLSDLLAKFGNPAQA